MKKILIFYGSYGGGHLSAAKAIKAYIEETYENKYEVEIVVLQNKITDNSK